MPISTGMWLLVQQVQISSEGIAFAFEETASLDLVGNQSWRLSIQNWWDVERATLS